MTSLLCCLHTRCPFNFFRSSNDIQAAWGSVFRNLQSVVPHQPWHGADGSVLTGPGCFAYPDTLEVGNLATFEEDRSNFGAWVIVSSPLILGHDLTDDSVMDAVWPIITNKFAISISQSFGPNLHPGGLVRTWSPPSAPTAPPNRTLQFAWALPPGPSSTGWAVPNALPFGTTGPVRHTSETGTTLCLGVGQFGRHKGKVVLGPCASPLTLNQTWSIAANGNLGQAVSNFTECLTLANGRGPEVELFRCKPGKNEEFNFSKSNATLCSSTVPHAPLNHYDVKCLAARNTAPDGNSGDGTMQLWAKPQPNGAVAVFLLNNLPVGSSNVSATISLAELNFSHGTSAGASSSVFDVWAGKALPPLPAGSTELHTTAIGSHDSALLLITPGS